MSKLLALPLVVGLALTAVPSRVAAQAIPDLLMAPAASAAAASRRDVPAKRVRKARLNPSALDSATIRLHLFDDVQPTMHRQKLDRPASDKMVWVGDSENGAQAVLSVVRGVLTGTVFADNRTFEISVDPDGQYSVAELDPSAFPTDDPIFDDARFEILNVPDALDGDGDNAVAPTLDTVLDGTPVQIDVMVVWTPLAETAAGGKAAMESLAQASVANANLVYANSGVNAQLRLVYGAVVSYVENGSNISGDLSAVRTSGDGVLDVVHTLRTQYGADVVTLIGEGYRSAGACGVASLMSTITTSFAPNAFNVVDRTCAVGNLSYAHEVGHNEGLQHDPANASTAPSAAYAYGYQEPSGYFRTVMAYGSATRIAYLSSPGNQYNGMVTGTSSQDNVRALNATVGTVAAFKSTGGTTPPPPAPAPTPCTYSVSTTSLSFAAGGGSKAVTVTAPTGCSWTTANDTASTWVTLSTTGGSGSGSVTVTAAANTGSARSTTVTIAGKTVAVNESAPKGKGRK